MTMTESEYIQQLVTTGSCLDAAREIARVSFESASEADYDDAENDSWDDVRYESAVAHGESAHSGMGIPETN